MASDPDGGKLYFVIISGPSWLDISLDGELSGTPEKDDVGSAEVSIQVNASGGYDRATFDLSVFRR